MAQMGVSAPMSLAGTLAVENAEILAGICITQLIRPGMPVCYGGICHAFDMRTTQMIFGGPEQAIFGVAMTQMGKNDPSLADFTSPLPFKLAQQILIGEAVKTITLNTLAANRFR